jgi:hypothetical protein
MKPDIWNMHGYHSETKDAFPSGSFCGRIMTATTFLCVVSVALANALRAEIVAAPGAAVLVHSKMRPVMVCQEKDFRFPSWLNR